MPQILQAWLYQYVNHELSDIQARFSKGRGTRDQMANICWIIEKRIPEKHLLLLYWLLQSFCVDHNKLWKILKRDGNTRPPYLPPEKSVCRSGSNSLNMEQQAGSKLGKQYIEAVYYHPAHYYAEYIMWNARLEEAEAGIKTAGRNINNLRYADYTTFMAESEEELKSLLMKLKEEGEKVGLKLNTQKTKIMSSGPITSWQIDEETVATVRDFIFWGPPKPLQMVTPAMKLKDTYSLEEKLWPI